jgi:hypothetical protein
MPHVMTISANFSADIGVIVRITSSSASVTYFYSAILITAVTIYEVSIVTSIVIEVNTVTTYLPAMTRGVG